LSKMDRSDKQKLIDSLFEIETMKKEEQMRQVVDSLKGDLTPAVAECVFNFAQGSFELDSETLSMLKNRSSIPEWYSNIQKYTGEKRSQVRTLEALVALMDEESNGINSSIKDLLSGDVSVLFKAIKEIEDEFALVKDWPKEKITEWAIDNKGEHFFDDPKNLIKGIAIFSRANQITEKFPIRHTQMIALWLMLRKGDGNKGKIAQMSTGEGKSIAFAGLAILRAMAKSPVSVITTSWLLAKGDAEAKKEVIELFDMTVSYNCDPESEADDEIRKACYYDQDKQKLVDIVYGDVGSFERDLLLTEFHGKEIIPKERLDSTGSILVDEVDGLFLDNAGMVLYLSHNVDTLRFLERIFGHIWALVNHSSFQNAHPFDDRTIEAIHGIIQSKIESKEIVLPSYRLEHAAYMEMENIIKRKLNIWIRSALQAKMLRINNEYIIYDQGAKGKEKKSITVMDKGTGLEQLSLKWSNGLHQFLQFKHGLELAPDSLKAVFLSNYFFFKSFAPHIYGLSGTLGSSTEQTYLQDLYQVDLFKIP
ncbi:MAG: hypothetical protein ACXU9U_06000, partial [Parachlamydiaceae bacterium]